MTAFGADLFFGVLCPPVRAPGRQTLMYRLETIATCFAPSALCSDNFFQSAIMPDYWQLLGALSALTPKADTAPAELHVRYGHCITSRHRPGLVDRLRLREFPFAA